MNKKLILIFSVIILIGIILIIVGVQGQKTRRIAAECQANNIIDSNYSYVTFNTQGYSTYIVSLTAGLCKRGFAGRVESTTNLDQLIQEDINNQIALRDIQFNLSTSSGGTRGGGGHRVP